MTATYASAVLHDQRGAMVLAATKAGISAGPVVAILAIVAAAAIVTVVVVSYVFHHRSLSTSASQEEGQWATQFGSNPSLSSDPGKDEFSR
jgi:hypothetical protein